MEDNETQLKPNIKQLTLTFLNKQKAYITEEIILEAGPHYIHIIKADGTMTSYTRESIFSLEMVPIDD